MMYLKPSAVNGEPSLPDAGNRCHWETSSSISSSASRNDGMEMPVMESDISVLSNHLSRFTAAMIPMMIPKTDEISMPATASSAVFRKRKKISSDMFLFVMMDFPRSRCKRPFT